MRRAAVLGVVLVALGMLGWLSSSRSVEPPVPEVRTPSGVGTGWLLQALSRPAVSASPEPSRSIRGRVKGPHGPVAGVELRASREVLGESLSSLPCGDDSRREVQRLTFINCPKLERLSEQVAQRHGEVPVLARAISDTEGSFVLEGLEAGTYALWAQGSEGATVLQDVEAGRQDVELKLAASTRLSGTITGEEETPIAGALVTAIFETHSRFFETLTDGTGHFDLGALPHGDYVLLVSRDGWLTGREWVTTYKSRMERKIVLNRPLHVSGRVTRAGRQVSGARVVLESSSRAPREVLTDATGRFFLDGLSTHDSHRLIATHEEGGARAEVVFSYPEGHGRHALAQHPEVNLELMPATWLTGRVLDDARRPVAGAKVSVSEKTDEAYDSTVAHTRTDAEGRYALGPVKPGPLRLEVEAEGGYFPEEETWTDFPVGTSTRDLLLTPVSPIEGILVDESGQPVADARMGLSSEDRARAVGKSGPDGHFLLNAPRPGDYKLHILDERVREGSWNAKAVAPSRPRVVVALRPSVVGEVVDETGAAVPDVDVSLWAEEPTRGISQLNHVWTDARGRFSLPAPSSGHYLLSAELQQEGIEHSASQRVDLGEGQTHVRLRFEPGHALSGVVVDGRGQPLEEAYVSLRSSVHTVRRCGVGAPDWGVRTGPDGRFSFQAVSGESLELEVSVANHSLRQPVNATPRDSVHVEPGARDVRIVLIHEAEVHGRLVQADGSPLTEYLLNGQMQFSHSGEFSWPIVGTGTLQLEFSMLERPGAAGVRRSVPVQEEVDQDLGTIVLGEP